MSGGHFNYIQFQILDTVEDIDRLIQDNNKKDEYLYSTDYSPATIEKFVKAKEMLRLAAMMVERIDYLVSGDDGEDSFHRRWEYDMGMLKEIRSDNSFSKI